MERKSRENNVVAIEGFNHTLSCRMYYDTSILPGFYEVTEWFYNNLRCASPVSERAMQINPMTPTWLTTILQIKQFSVCDSLKINGHWFHVSPPKAIIGGWRYSGAVQLLNFLGGRQWLSLPRTYQNGHILPSCGLSYMASDSGPLLSSPTRSANVRWQPYIAICTTKLCSWESGMCQGLLETT